MRQKMFVLLGAGGEKLLQLLAQSTSRLASRFLPSSSPEPFFSIQFGACSVAGVQSQPQPTIQSFSHSFRHSFIQMKFFRYPLQFHSLLLLLPHLFFVLSVFFAICQCICFECLHWQWKNLSPSAAFQAPWRLK